MSLSTIHCLIIIGLSNKKEQRVEEEPGDQKGIIMSVLDVVFVVLMILFSVLWVALSVNIKLNSSSGPRTASISVS